MLNLNNACLRVRVWVLAVSQQVRLRMWWLQLEVLDSFCMAKSKMEGRSAWHLE